MDEQGREDRQVRRLRPEGGAGGEGQGREQAVDDQQAPVSMAKESRRRRQIETVPLRRLGAVEDVAPLAVYFASDESAWVTGTIVPVNGGGRVPIGMMSYLFHINREMEAKEVATAAQ